ncbi:MAG: 50S ribosomal protein L21 [Bacteroidales bacterium]|nr:50S ribosomal protein L21 [Bacteroidales bacterium]
MYAIVDIAGQQFKVEKDKKIFVHRLDGNEGSQVVFEKVMLIDNDKDIIVGAPVIEGASVSASVLSHVRGDKVQIFKKKRRKGYRKHNGHRQNFTEILIESIVEKGSKKVAAKVAEPAKIEAVAEEAKPKAAVKKTTKKETGETPATQE